VLAVHRPVRSGLSISILRIDNAKDMQGRTALMFLMNYRPDDPAAQGVLHELLDVRSHGD
jgi:hypothetical protein